MIEETKQSLMQKITYINEKLAGYSESERMKKKNNWKSLKSIEKQKISKFMEHPGPKTKTPMKLSKKWRNTNKIVKKVLNLSQASNTYSYSGNSTMTEKNQHRNFEKNCQILLIILTAINLICKNVTISENLTKYRFLYTEADKVKNKLCYQFLWTWQGQILMRKDARAKHSRYLHYRIQINCLIGQAAMKVVWKCNCSCFFCF